MALHGPTSTVCFQTPARNDARGAAFPAMAEEEGRELGSTATTMENNEEGAASMAAGYEGGGSAHNASTGGTNCSPRTPPRRKRKHGFVTSRYLPL